MASRGSPIAPSLYCLGTDGVQRSDNLGTRGIEPGYFGRDRSDLPYMPEPVPPWGFLLSDAYMSLRHQRPSLTALQLVWRDGQTLGYLGADFDLRDLPVTAEPYQEPEAWRQVKGDPTIRGSLFQQCRAESPPDRNWSQALSMLRELLTERGIFQSQIHFSSSQALIWTLDDPYRYRILDQEALSDADICLVDPPHAYPREAAIPSALVGPVLRRLRTLRVADENISLRQSSSNLFNGMVSLTFSCDGSHDMPHDRFLQAGTVFWFGTAGQGVADGDPALARVERGDPPIRRRATPVPPVWAGAARWAAQGPAQGTGPSPAGRTPGQGPSSTWGTEGGQGSTRARRLPSWSRAAMAVPGGASVGERTMVPSSIRLTMA